jgi:hypothetical protein
MKSIFDKLNLRPQERRLVVGVAIIVFAVVNFWFIIPHFGDLGRVQQKKRDTEKKLATFKAELAKKGQYERDEKRLVSIGAYLPSEEQALELQREVYQQAQQSGVMIIRSDPSRPTTQRTNSFFEEQTLVIVVNTGEKELVDFLYGLGKGQSLTRVSSMSLQRDPTQTKLTGNIILVKSYQKKPPRAAPATVIATAAPKPPATKPATKPAPAPATNPPAANTNLARRPPVPAKK